MTNGKKIIAKNGNNLPVEMNVLEADAKSVPKLGLEDLSIPFLRILGDMSPQVKKTKEEYIEGAEPGMIFNTVTREIFDGKKGVVVIPCLYNANFLEWSDRGTGSSAPTVHSIDSDIMSQTTEDKDRKNRLDNGNYIERTHNHYCLILDEKTGATSQCLITMKSSQLKHSRRWNSVQYGIKTKGKNGLFTPATYSHSYRLTTRPESNDKGDWYGWNINKLNPVDRTTYTLAKSFFESIGKGQVKVKYESEEVNSGGSSKNTPF
jgi:hypothetical protein